MLIKEQISDNIAHNVYTLMTNTRISYRALSEISQLGTTKLKNIVYQKQSPKVDELVKIAECFGVCPIELMSKKI